MDSIYVLRVFVNEKGEFGNPLALMIDEYMKYDRVIRQRMAKKSRLSEVVFINSIKETRISIYSPQSEIDFAGHAALGTAYFFFHVLKDNIHELYCRGGKTDAWQDEGLTWIRSSLKNTPPWNIKQAGTSAAVDGLTAADASTFEHTLLWTWINKDKGTVRARTFAPDWGITEDEANGSGAMRLASLLKRDITVYHGKGSLIYAGPDGTNHARLGGRVKI